MSDVQAKVDDLLAAGRPDEALRVAESELQRAPEDTGLWIVRARCLMEVGQFELALDVARSALAREPGNPRATEVLRTLEPAMAPPAHGPTDPLSRPYRSDLPGPLLLRMQQALHHQTYRGVQMVKNPLDLMLYTQLIWNVRPATIVEIGSKAGGSGLYLGDLLRNFEIDGVVRSFDVVPVEHVTHPLVSFEYGNGRQLDEVLTDADVDSMARPLLIIEDADHTEATSSAVLAFFDRYLTPGDWIVVEDGNLSDIYPQLYPDWSSGPHRALQAFLRRRAEDYRIGAEYCDFYAYNGTTASNGFLERIDRER